MLQFHQQYAVVFRRLERRHHRLPFFALELPAELEVRHSDKVKRLCDERQRSRRLREDEKLLVGRVSKNLRRNVVSDVPVLGNKTRTS